MIILNGKEKVGVVDSGITERSLRPEGAISTRGVYEWSENGTGGPFPTGTYDYDLVDEEGTVLNHGPIKIQLSEDRISKEVIYRPIAKIYTKPNCPFCVRARRLLDDKGIGYTEVSAVENREDLITKVTEATGTPPKTVPQIWLDDTYIGGYDQLVEHFRT